MIDWNAVLTWQNFAVHGPIFVIALAGLAYAWWGLR